MQQEIGRDVSGQIDIVRMRVRVLRHVRVRYARRCGDHAPVTAPRPIQPIAKNIASPRHFGDDRHAQIRRRRSALPYRTTRSATQRRHHSTPDAGPLDDPIGQTAATADQPAARCSARPTASAHGRNHAPGAQGTG